MVEQETNEHIELVKRLARETKFTSSDIKRFEDEICPFLNMDLEQSVEFAQRCHLSFFGMQDLIKLVNLGK
ncbi:MAG: hypothetical protein KAS04_04110 [Candidatus Aenigmarchaeota archaeon]|nr:hypothetical protein [Candidatus Aenigmarchaeota archaeon]